MDRGGEILRVCACVVLIVIQIKKEIRFVPGDTVYLFYGSLFAVLRYFAVGQ